MNKSVAGANVAQQNGMGVCGDSPAGGYGGVEIAQQERISGTNLGLWCICGSWSSFAEKEGMERQKANKTVVDRDLKAGISVESGTEGASHSTVRRSWLLEPPLMVLHELINFLHGCAAGSGDVSGAEGHPGVFSVSVLAPAALATPDTPMQTSSTTPQLKSALFFTAWGPL